MSMCMYEEVYKEFLDNLPTFLFPDIDDLGSRTQTNISDQMKHAVSNQTNR